MFCTKKEIIDHKKISGSIMFCTKKEIIDHKKISGSIERYACAVVSKKQTDGIHAQPLVTLSSITYNWLSNGTDIENTKQGTKDDPEPAEEMVVAPE